MFSVEVQNIAGAVTAVGSAGPFTVVIDRPEAVGGGGRGFNGGELLLIAVAGCISNDLFREADARGLSVHRVVVSASGDYAGDPSVSTGIEYNVAINGSSPDLELIELVRSVDQIAEIPNSLRGGTTVHLQSASILYD